MITVLGTYPVVALLAACFYGYMPFIFVLDLLGIGKTVAFVSIVSLGASGSGSGVLSRFLSNAADR